MFTVCFLSSAVRCQPLSRALTVFEDEVKIERGSESAQQFVDAMYHEFTLCEKAFEEFFLLAESNILGKDDYETLEALYKNYAAFLTHLYEFYVACFKREQGSTENIHYSKLDSLFTFEVRKLMRN
ncbi:hypothetical protein ERJ76_20605, partial [Vibrio anguillarum]|nr:hypothetical protein [Vibrio anguillarum]